MWEEAQKLKPARVTSIERIAPVSEPGTPLVMRGTVVDADGRRGKIAKTAAGQETSYTFPVKTRGDF